MGHARLPHELWRVLKGWHEGGAAAARSQIFRIAERKGARARAALLAALLSALAGLLQFSASVGSLVGWSKCAIGQETAHKNSAQKAAYSVQRARPLRFF